MTLLFHDGFDAYGSGGNENVSSAMVAYGGWSQSSTLTNGPGRFGTGRYAQNTNFTYTFPANKSTIIAGMGLYIPASSGNLLLFTFRDATTGQVYFWANTTYGRIEAYRGTGGPQVLLGQTANFVYAAATWNFWEFKVTFSQTVGTVEVRLNGATVLTLTNQDTCVSANEYANDMYTNGNYQFLLYDDIYVCDTAGSVNNDFLGDCRSIVLNPDADGTQEDWTRSTGADSFALVDEAPINDTDYIESSVNAQITRFTHQDLATTYAIKGVTHTAVVRKTDASATSARAHAFVSSTPYNGSTVALGTSYVGLRQLFEQNPNTGVAWTPAGLNAAEFGVESVI